MKRIGRIEKIRTAALFAAVTALGSSSAAYAQFVWDDGAAPDHNWSTPGNWSPDGVPTAADSARWNFAPSPTTVTLSAAAEASDLQINDVAVDFNLNNFALTVGVGPSRIDGNSATVVFKGPGSVTFGGELFVGQNLPFSPPADHARVTAQGGATINTTDMTVGRYRGAGIVTVTGAGTVWNDSGNTTFGSSTAPAWTYTQPRVELHVTNGGHYNFNLGDYASRDAHVFQISKGNVNESRVVIDGAGSQFNLTGGYGSNFKVGGYGSNSNWEITNGGVLNGAGSNLGLSFNAGTGVNTYTISGAGSKMSASQFGVALRSSDATAPQGPTVVNILTGGLLQATDFDGNDQGVTIGDRGRISLQGGTISVPLDKRVNLRDNGAASGAPATLEGTGTITGGHLRVEGDSIVRPGGSAATGTITLTDGSLDVVDFAAQLSFDLSTSTGAHDRIKASATNQTAAVPGVITYTNIGSGNSFTGTLDFLQADTLLYSGLTFGDIPLNTDGLDAILAAAGYTTRVTGAAPDSPGEYRYFIEPNAVGVLDALRLQLFGTVVTPTVSTWINTGAGDWNNPANWSAGVPNGIDHEARFLGAITANSSIVADSPVTVGTVRFNNANMYSIIGGGSLTMQVSTGSGLVDVQVGTHQINVPLIFASDTALSVASGASLKISDPVTVNAGKNVTQSGAGTVLYESTVNVLSGGSIAFGNSSHMAGLTLASGASAQITPGGNKSLNIDNLNVAAGRMNIQNNKLITDNPVGSASGGVYSGVSGLIQSGRNGGGWGGNGIVTTQSQATGSNFTSIGVATASQVKSIAAGATATWGGQTVTGSETLVMYTYGGDANLDGKINVDDYGHIDSNVVLPGVSGWFNGDFNYDGKINVDDYGIIDSNVPIQGAPFPTSSGSLSGVAAVPEPCMASLLLGAISAGAFRRRRRR
jgi:hypothetical protein